MLSSKYVKVFILIVCVQWNCAYNTTSSHLNKTAPTILTSFYNDDSESEFSGSANYSNDETNVTSNFDITTRVSRNDEYLEFSSSEGSVKDVTTININNSTGFKNTTIFKNNFGSNYTHVFNNFTIFDNTSDTYHASLNLTIHFYNTTGFNGTNSFNDTNDFNNTTALNTTTMQTFPMYPLGSGVKIAWFIISIGVALVIVFTVQGSCKNGCLRKLRRRTERYMVRYRPRPNTTSDDMEIMCEPME